MSEPSVAAGWEHFRHGADIGIRGIGPTKAKAFEQAALALSGVITTPEKIHAATSIDILCNSSDDEFLFLDWINALIFEMATRNMLFSRFQITLGDAEATLRATVWGEPVDVARHCPAVEPKGATFTELAVRQSGEGIWIAQCVVDV